MKSKQLFIFLINLFYSCVVMAQTHSGTYMLLKEVGESEYEEIFSFDEIIRRDTIVTTQKDTVYLGGSSIQEISEKLNMSYTDFVKSFLLFAEQNKSKGAKGDRYQIILKDFVAKIFKEAYQNIYVFRTYYYYDNRVTIYGKGGPVLDLKLVPDSVAIEFTFTQKGRDLANNFLNTPNEQVRVITKMLSDISSNQDINGHPVILNFDFQDYDFSEKRALFQFAKSVSLVMDSIKVKKIREAKLYFTFNKSVVEEYKSYVVGLYEMIDGVYVFDPQTGVREIVPKDKLGTLIYIRNQFLFARFDRSTFPDVASDQIKYQIVHELMNSDYPEIWEDYFFAIICILLLLVIGVICYLYIPRFSNYINTNYLLALCVTIIIGAEIVVLLIYMIEEMGSSSRIITLKDIIAFQLLLFLAVPILIGSFNKKEIP